MECNRNIFVVSAVLFCLAQVILSCNIRELNNVIEDHFKKELQLKKCAELNQKCQLDKDCCKHLECKMAVSDDGIENVCTKIEFIEDDSSSSDPNPRWENEKTDSDGNIEWLRRDNLHDSEEKKQTKANYSESDYDSDTSKYHEKNEERTENRRAQLIKENEELEKLFTEKEEREIEQLKALKEDAEIDELRKLRELKIKRKLQLLKELHELRSLKANDDFQQILDVKEQKRQELNETGNDKRADYEEEQVGDNDKDTNKRLNDISEPVDEKYDNNAVESDLDNNLVEAANKNESMISSEKVRGDYDAQNQTVEEQDENEALENIDVNEDNVNNSTIDENVPEFNKTSTETENNNQTNGLDDYGNEEINTDARLEEGEGFMRNVTTETGKVTPEDGVTPEENGEGDVEDNDEGTGDREVTEDESEAMRANNATA